MAESVVVLPPDSTGKSLRTQTGGPSNAHQQVVTLADSAGNLLGTAAAGVPVNAPPATLVVSTTAAVTTATTATLPAAGVGLFHYITSITIQRYAGAALTGASTPVVVTSTNLPGSLAWTFDTAAAIGTSQVQSYNFAGNPLKASAANTATTIVAPSVTSGLWRINVSYYTAS